jgi:replicative DNA helicase
MTLMFTESHQNQLYALDAEGIVIATLLQSQDTIAPLAAILTPDMFYMHLHGLIFGAATKIKKLGGEVNAQTVSEELFLQKVLKGMIDDYESQVYKIVRQHLPSASVIEYATIVRDKYKSRKYRDFCIQSAGLFSDLPVDEAKEKFESGLVELSKINSSEHTVPISKPMADVFTDLMEVYDRKQAGLMHEVLLPTGIRDFDALIGGGIGEEQFITILADTGIGKTTVLRKIIKTAASLGVPTLEFSIEMSAESMSQKIYSDLAQIPTTALRNGAIRNDQWEKLAQARESYIDLPSLINDQVRNIEDIISISRNYYAKYGRIGIIAIDYLQLIESTRKELQYDDRRRFVYACNELNALKKELKTRIILLSQIGRNVKDRADKRPTLHDAAESGRIEQTSDILISAFRDEHYNPDTTDRGIMELSILKGRSVPRGTIKVLFDGQYSTIQDLKHAY